MNNLDLLHNSVLFKHEEDIYCTRDALVKELVTPIRFANLFFSLTIAFSYYIKVVTALLDFNFQQMRNDNILFSIFCFYFPFKEKFLFDCSV